MFTMKQLKTMPRGVAPVSSTGVHRNTKMYMEVSAAVCTSPSTSTALSARITCGYSCQ